jgi:hypothetical protein
LSSSYINSVTAVGEILAAGVLAELERPGVILLAVAALRIGVSASPPSSRTPFDRVPAASTPLSAQQI